MGIFSSIDGLGRQVSRSVNLSLGMFDGIHIGHQEVLNASIRQARKNRGVAVAFTFPEHPAKHLRPLHTPPLLMHSELKAKSLIAHGMDHVILREFDERLANIEAAEFVEFLRKGIPSLKSLSVGKNFRFGKGRTGDAAFLLDTGRRQSLSVEIVESKKLGDIEVSSSRIRESLSEGKIEEANEMLGRDFSVSGEVLPGKALGRKIGFPTMNLAWSLEVKPALGVYAGWVTNSDHESTVPAVANFGFRPTLEKDSLQPKLEVHGLGDMNLKHWGYGSAIEMKFKVFIRPERKFDSIEKLKSQISSDCMVARRWLGLT